VLGSSISYYWLHEAEITAHGEIVDLVVIIIRFLLMILRFAFTAVRAYKRKKIEEGLDLEIQLSSVDVQKNYPNLKVTQDCEGVTDTEIDLANSREDLQEGPMLNDSYADQTLVVDSRQPGPQDFETNPSNRSIGLI
jgi:hypothetical protein